jgi:hypothetical protein
MSQIIENKHESTFENIYDKHSANLYGIILKISQDTKEAEEILIQSFKTFFQQNAKPVNDDSIFLHLLKITICAASEKLNLTKQNISKIILKDLKSNTALQLMELGFIPVKPSQHTHIVSANIG